MHLHNHCQYLHCIKLVTDCYCSYYDFHLKQKLLINLLVCIGGPAVACLGFSSAVNMRTKFEVRSLTVPEIIAGAQKLGQSMDMPRLPFYQNF